MAGSEYHTPEETEFLVIWVKQVEYHTRTTRKLLPGTVIVS